ncbi:MAG: hypothetical protein SGBAC_012932 [Bacillariaceae sp.]
MAEESDWELVSDSEPSESDSSAAEIHIQLPTSGVLPNQSTSEAPIASENSTNSFSVIEGVNALAVQSQAGSSISSFAHVPSNESLVGSSICGQFDLVSLSSGTVFFRCKRCQARIPDGTSICNICDLAQVANPCIEVDHQVALAQQKKEEQTAWQKLQFDENQLENLSSESATIQATYLAQKLMIQLEPYKSILQHDEEMYIVHRTHAFLHKAIGLSQGGSRPRVNLDLVCGFVLMDHADGTFLRLHGFRSDMKVPVYRNMENALHQFDGNRSSQRHYPSASLSPISEDDVMQKPLASMWIVVVVGTNMRFTRRVDVLGDAVLPLACLDAKTVDAKADEIGSLAKVVIQVIDDTFIDGLHLKVKPVARFSTLAQARQGTTADSQSASQAESHRNGKEEPVAQSSTSAQARQETTADCFQAKSQRKRNDTDHPWLLTPHPPPKVARKSTPQGPPVKSFSEMADQEAIDDNRENRFGMLSFFCHGVSMKDLKGLHHDTRTSLRFYDVPVSSTPKSLLHQFERYGFPAKRFDLFFLPMAPGYRPGILFLDFVDYRDIPEFCQLFCSRTESKTGFQFSPQYTKHQGLAALAAYLDTSPLEYVPMKSEV